MKSAAGVVTLRFWCRVTTLLPHLLELGRLSVGPATVDPS